MHNMNRRSFLRRLSLGVASLALPRRLFADGGQKPNVLFICVDDMNDWISCLGRRENIRTPNIDKLAKRGVLFTNAQCPAPLCNPTRTAIMTVLRPGTTGIHLYGGTSIAGVEHSRFLGCEEGPRLRPRVPASHRMGRRRTPTPRTLIQEPPARFINLARSPIAFLRMSPSSESRWNCATIKVARDCRCRVLCRLRHDSDHHILHRERPKSRQSTCSQQSRLGAITADL